MTQERTLVITGLATLLLAVAAAAVAVWAPEAGGQTGDAAAILAFVGAAAIAIERVIECGWTTLGNLRGTFWPLDTVSRQVDQLMTDVDTALRPFHEELEQGLATIAKTNEEFQPKLESAHGEIQKLRQRFDGLKQLPADAQR